MEQAKHLKVVAQTKIMKVGQCVIVDYSSHEDAVGGRLWECKTVTTIS